MRHRFLNEEILEKTAAPRYRIVLSCWEHVFQLLLRGGMHSSCLFVCFCKLAGHSNSKVFHGYYMDMTTSNQHPRRSPGDQIIRHCPGNQARVVIFSGGHVGNHLHIQWALFSSSILRCALWKRRRAMSYCLVLCWIHDMPQAGLRSPWSSLAAARIGGVPRSCCIFLSHDKQIEAGVHDH